MNFIDMRYFQKFCTEFHNLHTEVHRFDAAREIHERLSTLLGEKRVFFDHPPEEFKLDDELMFGEMSARNLRHAELEKSQPIISSLDIIAYAYLKEEIVNTP
jgi:hypothetical protein